ncbi:MAG TPA: response regulator transcription factor [Usitatibacter sp.]|nr:response regulator transcription factor [Usitatibacter sp.]
MDSIRVMLVDDHALVRMGFRLLLQATDDIEVAAEAGSGEEACRRYPEVRPDVVLLDISMPGIGGLDTLARLLAKDGDARVLVLSAHEDTIHPTRAIQAGALGYLTKRGAPEELIGAIRRVAGGKTFIEPAIAQEMAVARTSGGGSPIDVLTTREFQVFIALAQGHSANSIAQTMSLSPSTVGTHLYNIKQKLGAANSAELTLIAIRYGLIHA